MVVVELIQSENDLPILWITIAESFSERIRGDFELCDTMILISGDRNELGLGENECSIVYVIAVVRRRGSGGVELLLMMMMLLLWTR